MVAFTTGLAPIASPSQAKQRRAVAEALLAGSPAKTWADGLSNVAGSLTGSIMQNEISAAEAAGAEEVGGLFGGLSSESPEADIIAALSNPWASDGQQSVAQALLGQQFAQNDPYRQLQMEKLQQEIDGGGAADETYFGTPIFTQDAAGNLTANQIGNQGTFSPIALPEGQTLAPPTKEVDTGTEIITFDRFGNELFRTPKDNYTPAYDAAAGGTAAKNDAAVQEELESIESKMPGLRTVIGELKELAKTATYTMAGQLIDKAMREAGQEPTENAVARAKYISMVDNQILPLLRDTFGAQFTQKEGESLKATLGNPDLSPDEKQQVLDSFIQQKERDVLALRSRVSGASSSASGDVDSILGEYGL